MHRCGVELNNLCHQILPDCKDNTDRALFVSTLAQYNSVLNAYENHAGCDFDLVKLEMASAYDLSRLTIWVIYARYWFPLCTIGYFASDLHRSVCVSLSASSGWLTIASEISCNPLFCFQRQASYADQSTNDL